MQQKGCVVFLTTDQKIDRRILQQAASLENANWKVIIAALPFAEDGYVDDPKVVRIAQNKTVRLLQVRKLVKYLCITLKFYQKLRSLVWSNIDPESVYLRLFANFTPAEKPDIIVAVDLPTLPVAVKLKNTYNAKLVYDSHEWFSEQEFSAKERKIWHALEKKYIHACDVVITVNQSIANLFAQHYQLSTVHVLYNAISAEPNIGKTPILHHALGLAPQQRIVLFQGGLSLGRNLEAVVKSMRYVSDANIVLVVLGDGPVAGKLAKIIKKYQLQQRVFLHKAVPQEQLLAYTQSATVGLIPYQATCLNNLYCTPNKLFEFIAARLPIIANQLPEIKRIINTHQIGITGMMQTAKEIAHLITDFFAQPEKMLTWQQNVLKASAVVNWEAEEQKLLNIFAKLE